MSESPNFFANVDIVNFVLHDGALHVSLWKRQHEPFAGMLALPGAIINGRTPDQSLEDTVNRVIRERLGQEPLYIEQVMTVGNATRDARGWSLSTIYMALHTDDGHAEGVELVPFEAIESGETELPFDHRELILAARERLRSKSTYSSLPMLFLPRDMLTVAGLTEAYRAAINNAVQEITIRKRVAHLEKEGVIQPLGERRMGPGRPKMVYAHPGEVFFFERSILAK